MLKKHSALFLGICSCMFFLIGCNSFEDVSNAPRWRPLINKVGVMDTGAYMDWIMDDKPSDIKEVLYHIMPLLPRDYIKNKKNCPIRKGDRFKIVAVYDYHSFDAGRFIILARFLDGKFKSKLCEIYIFFDLDWTAVPPAKLKQKYAHWDKEPFSEPESKKTEQNPQGQADSHPCLQCPCK